MGFYDAYRKAIKEEINSLVEHIGYGNCKDFDEYKTKTGQVQGLTEAERIFNNTLNRFINEGEEVDGL